jgi:hypothetical protein
MKKPWDVFPSDEVVFAHLGRARRLWEQVMDRLPQVCPGAESQWRYYADGKSWLLKVTLRKKTAPQPAGPSSHCPCSADRACA